MKKCIIFDLDGTVYNSIDDIASSCNYALGKNNLPIHKIDKYRQFIGNGARVLIERAIGKNNLTEQVYDSVRKCYDEHYKYHYNDLSKPYDGIISMLELLKSNGIIIGVLSNKPHECIVDINKIDFKNIFDFAYGQRQGYNTKPDPTALIEIIECMNMKLCDCVYVGDSGVDVKTAKNANITSVAVTYGFRDKEELEQNEPDYICKNVDELNNVLLGLIKK